MRGKRLRSLAAVLCLTLLLSGCSAIGLNVETQLSPPRNNGEQEALRSALETYIHSNTAVGDVSDYTLVYPLEGDYRAAFITLDRVSPSLPLHAADAEPPAAYAPETASLCLAFYRRDSELANAHIHLLRRDKAGTWQTVGDAEGYGESIAEAGFADLDADGVPELLLGWNLYNSHDRLMTVYRLQDGLPATPFEELYSSFTVADMTADRSEDVVLLSTTGQTPAARLFCWDGDTPALRGEVYLDTAVQSFGTKLAASADGATVLYIDAYKESGAMVTELLQWNGERLSALFCGEDGLNSRTARELPLACRDIDGDGAVEWPVTTRLPGYEKTDRAATVWRADWMTWNSHTDTDVCKFSTIVVMPDGYQIRVRPEWETAEFRYDADARCLSLWDADETTELFSVVTVDRAEKLPEGFSQFRQTDVLCFGVRTPNPRRLSLSAEEIRYLFELLS